jgi:hypothetical protein
MGDFSGSREPVRIFYIEFSIYNFHLTNSFHRTTYDLKTRDGCIWSVTVATGYPRFLYWSFTFDCYWHWHWHLLSLLVTVYNVGHDSLVLCPLLNIFTFSTFILNYTTIALIFATPQFIIYSSSYFIINLFHFFLYLLKCSPAFCSLSLSLIVAILLIPIYESFIYKLLSPTSGFRASQYMTPAFFITHSLLCISPNTLQSPDAHFPPSYTFSSLLGTYVYV